MMVSDPLVHEVTVYYEDTDLTGSVYHANYLKYFERAREQALGVDALVQLYRREGIGFVVYKAELTYKKGAVFGDTIEIRTTADRASDFRLTFQQNVHRPRENGALLVEGRVEMVCVDRDGKLVPIPASVRDRL